jgi:hypothetical protein
MHFFVLRALHAFVHVQSRLLVCTQDSYLPVAVYRQAEAAGDAARLPKKLRLAAEQIPLAHNALGLAEPNINPQNVTETALQSVKPVLIRYKENAARVKDIFDKTMPTTDATRADRLKKAVGIKFRSNKGQRVHGRDIREHGASRPESGFQDAEALNDIKDVIEQLNNIPIPSRAS